MVQGARGLGLVGLHPAVLAAPGDGVPGKRLKELERENARLKRLLADAELDKAILREAANPNF